MLRKILLATFVLGLGLAAAMTPLCANPPTYVIAPFGAAEPLLNDFQIPAPNPPIAPVVPPLPAPSLSPTAQSVPWTPPLPQAPIADPPPGSTTPSDALGSQASASGAQKSIVDTFVNRKSFELTYDVEKVGASGVAGVKVWYTRAGDAWSPYPGGLVKSNPMKIHVDGEGRFGFILVPQSGVGLTAHAPRGGDEAQVWVTVDMTPPSVTLFAPYAREDGMVEFSYDVKDVNLRPSSIRLLYREGNEGPWTVIGEKLPIGGRTVHPAKGLPSKCYLRLEAEDLAGNTSQVSTPEPVTLDGLVPKIGNVRVNSEKRAE